MTEAKLIRIEVSYARPEKQVIKVLEIEPGLSVLDAIEASGISTDFPDIVVDPARLGVFGVKISPDYTLREGDRIEIYRALIADPKESRRKRARQAP